MKLDRERCLMASHLWSSCALSFGLGYLVLSHVTYGIVIAWLLAVLGALVKAVVLSRSQRYADSRAAK